MKDSREGRGYTGLTQQRPVRLNAQSVSSTLLHGFDRVGVEGLNYQGRRQVGCRLDTFYFLSENVNDLSMQLSGWMKSDCGIEASASRQNLQHASMKHASLTVIRVETSRQATERWHSQHDVYP
jgi:hypothetical protein